jgi:hypothetical protein
MDIRLSNAMEGWRTSLGQELLSCAPLTSVGDVVKFREHLQQMAERHRQKVRRSPELASLLTEMLDTGIAVPPVALAFHQEPAAAAASALAPLIPNLARKLGSWFVRGGQAADLRPGDGISKARSVQSFMVETYCPNSPLRRTPSSAMTTLDGRPLWFDPFHGLED